MNWIGLLIQGTTCVVLFLWWTWKCFNWGVKSVDKEVNKLIEDSKEAIKESNRVRDSFMQHYEDMFGIKVQSLPFGGGKVSYDSQATLEEQLQDAIDHDEFERAAMLRDKIKQHKS
jgi:excinuclease UvrABC helicase subunit UvrB